MDLEIQILQILQTFLQEVSIIFTATHMHTHTQTGIKATKIQLFP